MDRDAFENLVILYGAESAEPDGQAALDCLKRILAAFDALRETIRQNGKLLTDQEIEIAKQKAEIDRLRIALSLIGYGCSTHEEIMRMVRRALEDKPSVPEYHYGHAFQGRLDRWCELCGKPDRHPIHQTIEDKSNG